MNTPTQNISYKYTLPESLLAKEPATPRDHSRLFVYDSTSDEIVFDHFYHIDKYLPSPALMVLNETTVAPSRITLYKQSGGKVTCLFLLNEKNEADEDIRLMVDRHLEPGESLYTEDKTVILTDLQHAHESIFTGILSISREKLFSLLDASGTMPIPLYLRKTKLGRNDLKEKYQTVFATPSARLASVAAPTASLHFTPEIFQRLHTIGIKQTKVRLEVGLGTFAPLTEGNLVKGELHTEWYSVASEAQRVLQASHAGKVPVIAVGTTTVRALESFAMSEKCGDNDQYFATKIFIRPGYKFRYVNKLITNFHLPESSLMMLVEALLQSKDSKRHLVELYEIAVKERFRFFSFGDSMLIL